MYFVVSKLPFKKLANAHPSILILNRQARRPEQMLQGNVNFAVGTTFLGYDFLDVFLENAAQSGD